MAKRWTPAEVRMVRQGARADKSATEVAASLPGRSASAVHGLAVRRGIQFLDTSDKRSRTHRAGWATMDPQARASRLRGISHD